MDIWRIGLAISLLCVVIPLSSVQVRAQTIVGKPSLALKSGETAELANVYWAINCRSLLKSVPQAEILDGPPGVMINVQEAMVTPRWNACPKAVPGGKLLLSAKDIQDQSYGSITIRVTFKTKDGDRQRSKTYNLSLFPSD
jgi:hypothetical protein